MLLLDAILTLTLSLSLMEFTVAEEGEPAFVDDGTSFAINVKEGDNETLRCEVVNIGKYHVAWVKVGEDDVPVVITMHSQLILEDPRISIQGDAFNKTFNLRIEDISIADQGKYLCQISTTPPLTTQVTLTVHLPAKITGQKVLDASGRIDWDTAPTRFVYNESDTVEISCEVDGEPPAEVEWRKPDGVIKSDSQWLRIGRISRHDSGVYTCAASNSHEIVTHKIEVVVQYKPEVTVRFPDIRLAEGCYVTLQCGVDAYPRPQYIWMKGNETILDRYNNDVPYKSTSTRIPLGCYPDKTRLIIVSMDPESDYGNYTCIAKNNVGKAKGVIEVSGRPRGPRVLSPSEGLRKHQYTLKWDYGELKPDHPAFINVDMFVITYRGWWLETQGDKTRVRFSNNIPQKKTYKPNSRTRLPMVLELQDLRENIEYSVFIWGVNKYGIGNKTEFNFTTSKEDKLAIFTTPIPNYGQSLNVYQDLSELAKYWHNQNCCSSHHYQLSLVIVLLVLSKLWNQIAF